MKFADRVTRVEPSATLAISSLAATLTDEGADVIDLSVGEPDFPTPQNIIEAGKDALDAGHTGYVSGRGIPTLNAAIVEKFEQDGLQYDQDEILVTPGAKQALFEVIQAVVDDGEEVVLLDPAWVSYEAMVKLAGGSLTRVNTAPYDFALEPALDDLSDAVSDETKLLIVNSPGNPHGAVYSDAALKGVRDLAVEHDITVISDEIYKEITYDGVEQTSLGTLDGMADRTITVNGFSKTYSMTGWRLGYVGAHQDIISQASIVQSHSVTCAPNFVQHAGVEALTNTEDAVDEMVSTFEHRRNTLIELLNDHGIEITVPKGAFYLMVPVAEDDQTWCETALEEAYVATTPGSAFGTPGYARFSYAKSEERLHEAITRLADHELL